MKITVVIMAGGKGERFWPKSRQIMPKQFLSITEDGKTMIELTRERIAGIVDIEDIFVLTNNSYKNIVTKFLPDLPKENIICEPVAKNTAPCIAVAASIIKLKYNDAVMVVLPSDHLIKDEQEFRSVLHSAVAQAQRSNCLITLGIKPNYPETGYGYIDFDKNSEQNGFYKVKQFVEKPDKKTAETYLAEGTYLWNSGMFAWKVSSILSELKRLLPDVYDGAGRVADAYMSDNFEKVLAKEFDSFPSMSIDYAVMEKATDILTIPSDFGWNDVGCWSALSDICSKDANSNVILGEVVALKTSRCIIAGGKRLIATLGIEDLIIVDTPDALLITKKSEAQNIKLLISEIKTKKNGKYL